MCNRRVISAAPALTSALALLLAPGPALGGTLSPSDATAVAAADHRPPILVIQTLVTDGTDSELALLARDLTEEVVVRAMALAKPGGLDVRSESELRSIAEHAADMADLRPENCHRLEHCLAKIFDGRADQILRGTLGRLHDNYVVTLKLIDVASAGGVIRAEACTAETQGALIEALSAALETIFQSGSALRETATASTASPGIGGFELPSDGRKVGVMPISGSAADRLNADTLTEILGVAIRTFGFSAQTRGDIISMINYATDRHGMGDRSLTEVIMDIAQAAGVSMLVSGNIGRIEKTHVIILKLIDLDKGEVVHRVSEFYIGPENNLPTAMRYACAKLFGRASNFHGDSGPLTISAGADPGDLEGRYRIDQQPFELLPQAIPKIGLHAGKHQLHILAEGYFPYYAELYLPEDEPLRFHAELEPLPAPWYASPLAWTIAGLVVAGAATAITLVVRPRGVHARGDVEDR